MKPLDDFLIDKLEKHFSYMLDASAKLCPYETGETRSSGYININKKQWYSVEADDSGNVVVNKVETPSKLGNNIVISIGYSNPLKTKGGYVFDLAVWLHEDFYTPKKTGTQAKYLETVVKRYKSILEKSLDSALKQWLILQFKSQRYANAKTF